MNRRRRVVETALGGGVRSHREIESGWDSVVAFLSALHGVAVERAEELGVHAPSRAFADGARLAHP